MYKILLMACGNVDHMENPYDNIVNGIKVHKSLETCESIKECQEIAKKYIDTNNLGSGNWNGGAVYDDYGNQIGYVSYNGKYWEKGSRYYLENKLI